MAIALKMIGSLNPDQYNQAIEGMVGVIASLIALVAAYGLLVNGDATKNAEHAKICDIKALRSVVVRFGAHYHKDGARF